MRINRRTLLLGGGAMTLSAAAWTTYRQTLLDAEANVADSIDNVTTALTGFARAPYQKRCSAGHCNHQGYFHICQGWNPSAGAFVSSHYRTQDFMVAERAVEPLGMTPVLFNEAASFDNRIYRGPGYDVLPAVLNDDLVTNAIWSSATGSAPWVQESNPPPLPREVASLLVHDGHLYQFLGEAYTGHANPTYAMRTDAYRKAPGGNWEQRANNLPKRRSFAYLSWNGAIFVIGGADDNHNGQDYRKVYGDILRSDDGMQSLTNLGDGPFGPGYGRRMAVFNGHVVLVGGAAGDGGFAAPVAFTNKVWASNHPGLIPSSWFELAPLPQALNHSIVGVLTIDGVETLGVIGGYNNVTHSGGGPLGTVYTLNALNGSWVARTDSDFWTA
jgi:hypothetical protein